MMTSLSSSLKKAETLLQSLQGEALTRSQRISKTEELATLILQATVEEKTLKEKKREMWMARMMQDPQGRTFLTAMTDQCFRSSSAARTTDQLLFLLKKFGIPQFLTENEKLKFLIFRLLGPFFPRFFIPMIKRQIRGEMQPVLFPEGEMEQVKYFSQAKKEKIQINLNHLGEAILGEQEAANRLHQYQEDLKNPFIEYISIKISTLYSQINLLSFDHSLTLLSEKLRLLYRLALSNPYVTHSGETKAKFVNLDMEEYKDLDLTIALFQKVLSEPEFKNYQGGIVLQSYLPDSFENLRLLTSWAKERIKKGGAPIKVRIVKGANLAMEMVESSIYGWELPTFSTKMESDSQFKRMLEYVSTEENASAAHIGIGSHNLFDIAYALILRAEKKLEKYLSFEMLEGMAQPLQRIVKQLSGTLLLYCPEAKERNFQSAIAYLIRRLDENGANENFLRHFFEIRPPNIAWKTELEKFKNAADLVDHVVESPRRTQNRHIEPPKPNEDDPFKNESDTDFSLHANRLWAHEIYQQWKTKKQAAIPLVIGGENVYSMTLSGIDPSCPSEAFYEYHVADVPLIEKALSCALEFEKSWGNLPTESRFSLLSKAAHTFRGKRDQLIGVMIADGGKTVGEADSEVSEAIDFIEYYYKNWKKQLSSNVLRWNPLGTILVAPPWNFPCSIPVGGIAAALTAGNCVIFKPAPEAVLIGWYVVNLFWEAGIPKEVLQFINCKEEPVGSYLVKHPKIAAIILTGATQTAQKFLKLRPEMHLHAETGGKNAIIVTAMADRDQAVKDILNSAFKHSGQKCSACSLAILEEEVYEDHQFKKQLLDAASSLIVGSAWDPQSKITPLIKPPEGALLKGLTSLEEGETWLLEPRQVGDNPHLWSPGIKWGVKAGSFTHQTELFGPLLGVMKAASLPEAIRIANGTPYGLTSGLHSLDEREHTFWKNHIAAGNLYINRGITGAVVRRQPFGGCKASSFGPGAKAGGPNYVNQFAHPTELEPPSEKGSLPQIILALVPLLKSFNLSKNEIDIWMRSAENYAYWAKILKEPIDPTSLIGQDNYFYHVPHETIYMLFRSNDPLLSLFQAVAASLICGAPIHISTEAPLLQFNAIPLITVHIEDEKALFKRNPHRIRLFSPPSSPLFIAAAAQSIYLQHAPVLSHGRFELLHYMREVSLSVDYHRYGYLGLRTPQNI